MPEGDTIHHAAERLRPALVGQTVTSLGGSHRAVIREGRRINGRQVVDVRSVGKHLMIDFDNAWALRTHLGMPGSWHLYRPGERWRKTPGAARVVLETPSWVAVCFSAPTVQLAPVHLVEERIAHLGPDGIADDFDRDEVLRRAMALPGDTLAADLVADQTVMAGVGNVFKNEILFLERIHPRAELRLLDPAEVTALIDRGRKLLVANRTRGRRNTTGTTQQGHSRWVYGRGGDPCRRCGSAIESEWVGVELPRITYWCPTCQPERSASLPTESSSA